MCLLTTRADYARQRSCSEELWAGTGADGNAPQWGVDVIRARERHHRTLHVYRLRFELCAWQIDHLWRLNKKCGHRFVVLLNLHLSISKCQTSAYCVIKYSEHTLFN